MVSLHSHADASDPLSRSYGSRARSSSPTAVPPRGPSRSRCRSWRSATRRRAPRPSAQNERHGRRRKLARLAVDRHVDVPGSTDGEPDARAFEAHRLALRQHALVEHPAVGRADPGREPALAARGGEDDDRGLGARVVAGVAATVVRVVCVRRVDRVAPASSTISSDEAGGPEGESTGITPLMTSPSSTRSTPLRPATTQKRTFDAVCLLTWPPRAYSLSPRLSLDTVAFRTCACHIGRHRSEERAEPRPRPQCAAILRPRAVTGSRRWRGPRQSTRAGPPSHVWRPMAGASWGGKWARPGSAASPTTRPLTTRRLQSRRPGRLVAGRTHGQGSRFPGCTELHPLLTAGGARGRTPRARARRRRGRKSRSGSPARAAPSALRRRPRRTPGTPRGARARRTTRPPAPRTDLPLVPVVEDGDARDEQRDEAGGECEAEHEAQYAAPSRCPATEAAERPLQGSSRGRNLLSQILAAAQRQGRQDSNLQPPVLETGALPIELRPCGCDARL